MSAESPAVETSVPVAEAVEDPRWISDGLHLWLDELRLFASTAWGLLRSPARFTAEWARGERKAMNPFGFLAATWSILFPVDYGLQRLMGWDTRANVSFWVEIARSLRPYLFVLPATLIAHVVFRLIGSRRRISSTLAVFLYATAFSILGWVLGLLACWPTGLGGALPRVTTMLCAMVGAFAFEGLHRVRWWWCVAVMLGSLFAATFGINSLLDLLRLS
jgi:hypothetical protein